MTKLPAGFEKLIERVIKEDPVSKIKPSKDVGDWWFNLVWCAFLGNNRRDAEVNYLYNIFENTLSLKLVSKLSQTELTEKMEKIINNEITNSDGREKGVLEGARHELNNISLCLKGIARYFNEAGFSTEFIKEKTRDNKSIEEFIGELTYKEDTRIPFIGTTKAILWLQAFGLSDDFCPPSRQVRDFIDYDIEQKTYKRNKDEDIDDRIKDWEYISKVRHFSRKQIQPLIKNATVRDVGKAIWYYKSAQSLVSQFHEGLKSKLTPVVLLDYLDENKMKLDEFAEKLGDIKEVDNLTNELRTFVK